MIQRSENVVKSLRVRFRAGLASFYYRVVRRNVIE